MFDRKFMNSLREQGNFAMQHYEARFGSVHNCGLSLDIGTETVHYIICSRGGVTGGAGLETIFHYEEKLEGLTPDSFYNNLVDAIDKDEGPLSRKVVKGDPVFEEIKGKLIGSSVVGEKNYADVVTWGGLMKSVSLEMECLLKKSKELNDVVLLISEKMAGKK